MFFSELPFNDEIGCEEDDDLPLACLRDAAFFNDVETLKQLLDSPTWYRVRDYWGCTFLNIAIHQQNDEVFDYLLSLDEFPLDEVDAFGCTPLQIVIEQYGCCEIGCEIYERYMLQLIKNGADINGIRPGGQPILHYAFRQFFPLSLVQSLIEGGADLNIRNKERFTPLFMVLHYASCENSDMSEAVTMLLYYGADPSITYYDEDIGINMTTLDYCLRNCFNMDVALENLFYFTVDEFSSHTFFGGSLFYLIEYGPHLFHQAIKGNSGIIFDKDGYDCDYNLFTIDLKYLWALLDSSPHMVKEYLQNYCPGNVGTSGVDLNRFEMLTDSSVSSDAIELISRLNSCGHMVLIPNIKDINELMKAIYYFLSYGATLKQRDLDFIYERTGYTEDFKNLLFMDIIDGPYRCHSELFIPAMMPRLIYDVTLDIHKLVEDPSQCEFINWEELFHYFVHPKIQTAYHHLKPYKAAQKQLPRIPLLQELARDSFRKYFLKVFKITKPKQFYSLVKLLPISDAHKRIITYESRLY